MSARPRAVVCSAGSRSDATSAPKGFVSDSASNAVPSSHIPASAGAHRRPRRSLPASYTQSAIGPQPISAFDMRVVRVT